MSDHITRYDRMPIPATVAHTEFFDAGVVRFGVEYRVLTDEVVAAIRATLDSAAGTEVGQLENLDDRGVSLHVYGRQQGQELEYLRFDCFQEDPHYHYVNWAAKSNEMLHIDPVVEGDALAWALERIRTRLPQMLTRAGAGAVAAALDGAELERVLPRVIEAAYRLRYQAD